MSQQTTDLHFAAFVMALDHTLLPPTRKGHKVTFHFEIQASEWGELLTSWGSRQGTVVAYDYAESLRALKSLVHTI